MKYRLGDLTIDTGSQLVARGTDRIALPKLSYDLLMALIGAAPDLLAPDELMRLVWPGLVVSPETVSQRVKILRDALGDDPRAPRYIAGLRGRGYQVAIPVEKLTENLDLSPGEAPLQSVAVLPFLDMSEKKDQEYFADGLAEEVISLLTKIPELRVPARTSSFYFKGKLEDVPTIAKKLMVSHVLEGSVRKSGDRLRVTAQLVQANSGYQLWSETYDRRLDDVFAVQDDIAASVVKALKIRLLGTTIQRTAPTANSEAYTLYLQAESLAKRADSESTLRAHECLTRAVRLDPNFALAWAATAELYTNDSAAWGTIFPLDARAGRNADLSARTFLYGTNRLSVAAHEAGARALELGVGVAEVHRAMAHVLRSLDFDWAGAASELETARRLDPGDARILQQSAQLAMTAGRLAESLALANRAAVLDPLGSVHFDIGWAHYCLGELEQAETAWRHLLELHPTMPGARFRFGLLRLSQGRPEAALEEMAHDEPWYRDAGIPLALDALGRRSAADKALAAVERNWGTGMAYQISYVYLARGEIDSAVNWLERAYENRDLGLVRISVDPRMKVLAGNLRFRTLLGKLKLL